MKRIKVNKLILRKKDIEKDIKRIEDKVSKSCKHNIKFAYYFPYKCEKCSLTYIKYCVENNLAFESRVEYMIHYDKILASNKRAKEREIKQKQLAREREIKQKQLARERELLENERLFKIEEARKFKENMKDRKFLLKHCIENYRNKKLNRSSEELGARYERQIGYIYEQQGDRVEYNGIYYGKKDKGIDLIIKKKNVHYVIQCKNYSSTHEIHLNTIDQFNSVINRYKRENKGQKVYGILCTSNDNLDADAKKELEILDITHNVEPYSVNYPLVKCKKESMIYHLPCNANYDRIKINIKKGDIYLETPQEAIDKGFRPANN